MKRIGIILALAIAISGILASCGTPQATTDIGTKKTNEIISSETTNGKGNNVDTSDKTETGSQEDRYNRALSLMNEGKYDDAYDLFSSIRGYKDSDDYLGRFVLCYDKVVQTKSDGNIYTTEYTYDSNGKRIKKITKTSSGDTYTIDYTYDSNGNLT